MALWSDIITPADLTGYVRDSLNTYEAQKGTLAAFLPNREVADTVVRFVAGQAGLIDIDQFRAYDAEPQTGKGPSGKRVTLELPALGQEIPVSEYAQLRQRNAPDDSVLNQVLITTERVARATADAIERLRGIVIETGKATINTANFGADSAFFSDDDFGRYSGNTVTAATLWSTGSVSRLTDLQTWTDAYIARNGVPPATILLSTRVLRALGMGTEFQVQLLNGGARPARRDDINAIIEGAGLPPITVYDRRVGIAGTATKVLSDNKLFLLPEAVDPNDSEGSQLGSTFWGQTLTSTDSEYDIADVDQPGIVAGVYRNEKPPLIAQVVSDAIALPVMANADLSFAATVL